MKIDEKFYETIFRWFDMWVIGMESRTSTKIRTIQALIEICDRSHSQSALKNAINGLYLVAATRDLSDEFLLLHFSFVDDDIARVLGSNTDDNPEQLQLSNFYIEIGTDSNAHMPFEDFDNELLYPNGPPIVESAGFEVRDVIFTNRGLNIDALNNSVALLNDAFEKYFQFTNGGVETTKAFSRQRLRA